MMNNNCIKCGAIIIYQNNGICAECSLGVVAPDKQDISDIVVCRRCDVPFHSNDTEIDMDINIGGSIFHLCDPCKRKVIKTLSGGV